mgnify:CR=1 FL=1
MKLSVKRLFAYWLDFVLLAVVLVGLQGLVYISTGGFPFDAFTKGYQIECWVLFSMSLPVWAYFVGFERYRRQTVGKRLLGLQVASGDGSAIRLRQAFGRTLVRLLPWELTHLIVLVPQPWWDVERPANGSLIYIPNALIVLYIAVLLANRGKRGVHDFLAGTKIVESN